MPAQFDVYRMQTGSLVLILQSDLLDAMQTRVVAPMLPKDQAGPALRDLTPVFEVAGMAVQLMPQLAATLTLSELGQRLGSLALERDRILRATDMLLSGI